MFLGIFIEHGDPECLFPGMIFCFDLILCLCYPCFLVFHYFSPGFTKSAFAKAKKLRLSYISFHLNYYSKLLSQDLLVYTSFFLQLSTCLSDTLLGWLFQTLTSTQWKPSTALCSTPRSYHQVNSQWCFKSYEWTQRDLSHMFKAQNIPLAY